MGRSRKPFIDKKRSTTYNVVYGNTESGGDVDAVGRVFVDSSKGVGVGKIDEEAAAEAAATSGVSTRRYPPGHPLAWLEDEASGSSSMTPERRKELMELGFPDDGYDYLQHLLALGGGAPAGRVVGPATVVPADETDGSAAAEDAAPGPRPGVFVAAHRPRGPAPDEALYDAHRLVLLNGVSTAATEADQVIGGVTAFSQRRTAARGTAKAELEELEMELAAVEGVSDDDDAAAGEDGLGDLLDDFVAAATAADDEEQVAAAPQAAATVGSESEEEGYDSEELETGSSEEELSGDEADDVLGALPGERWPGRGTGPKAGSIASTYWREERHDRRGQLSTLDDHFEHVALEYDEDEIGDLSDRGSDLEGELEAGELAPQLVSLLTVDEIDKAARLLGRGGVNRAAEGSRASALAEQLGRFGLSDDDADVAVAMAKQAAAQEPVSDDEDGVSGSRHGGAAPRGSYEAEHHERERWDAETVLSLRSNLDNHPGRIGAGVTARQRRAAEPPIDAPLRLNRAGFPVEVGAPRRARDADADADAGAEATGTAPAALPRSKDETAEEKRERKAAVKEAQRAARAAKKELKTMFKEERGKAARRAATAQPQAALHLP